MNEKKKKKRNDNYLSVMVNLKTAAVEKMRLMVTDYSQGEYL